MIYRFLVFCLTNYKLKKSIYGNIFRFFQRPIASRVFLILIGSLVLISEQYLVFKKKLSSFLTAEHIIPISIPFIATQTFIFFTQVICHLPEFLLQTWYINITIPKKHPEHCKIFGFIEELAILNFCFGFYNKKLNIIDLKTTSQKYSNCFQYLNQQRECFFRNLSFFVVLMRLKTYWLEIAPFHSINLILGQTLKIYKFVF